MHFLIECKEAGDQTCKLIKCVDEEGGEMKNRKTGYLVLDSTCTYGRSREKSDFFRCVDCGTLYPRLGNMITGKYQIICNGREIEKCPFCEPAGGSSFPPDRFSLIEFSILFDRFLAYKNFESLEKHREAKGALFNFVRKLIEDYEWVCAELDDIKNAR